MATSHIFRIMFVNQGKVYEVYARKVSHGELFGFIEVEELLFGERSSVVLDPGRGAHQGRVLRRQAHLPAHALDPAHRRGAQARGEPRSPCWRAAPTWRSSPCRSTRRRRARRSDRRAVHAAARRSRRTLRVPHRQTLERLARATPSVEGVEARYVHFVDLTRTARRARAAECWKRCSPTGRGSRRRPAERAAAVECVLVVPRLGTISPWSSKASEIAQACGLGAVRRIERGIAYRLHARAGARPGAAAAARRAAARSHDRGGAAR